MPRRATELSFLALASTAAALLACATPAQQTDAPASVAAVNHQPWMNVFRRYDVDDATMFAFYTDVIGLERLGSFEDVGAGGVHRFQAGDSELKLTRRVPDRNYVGGAIKDATGLRYITLFFPDAAVLSERFAAAGLPAPEFHDAGAGMSAAFVQDPDDQWLKLVAAPGQSDAFYRQVSVGVSVSDLDEARAFYRDFAGLEEHAAIEDGLLGAAVHPFRHGSTTIAVFHAGDGLPADTGSGGVQYVVSDAALVDRLAQERGVTIETPLSGLPGYQLRTIWLNDPDGITNYFAQVGAAPEGAGD